jgi:hypothetical protein
MYIKIEDHLSPQEIKEIVIDEARNRIRELFKDEKNTNRILSNISYEIVFDEVDKIIPNSKEVIKNQMVKILENPSSFTVFREKDEWRKESLATSFIHEAVKENKDLLKSKVKETIINKDYSKEIWNIFEKLGENFLDNIYEIVRLGRSDKA